MSPTKKKPDALSLADTGIDTSLEMLTELFQGLTSGVQAQMEAETDQQRAEADQLVKTHIAEALTKRDQLIEYRNAIEERELRIRKTVQVAEALARRYKAFVKNLDNSIYQYMTEAGLKRIEGTIHRFALYGQADELVVEDQSVLPPEYFTYEPWWMVLKKCKEFFDKHTELPGGESHGIDIAALYVALEMVLSGPAPGKVNKEKIIADLQAGIEIPGAFILKERSRLDVK